MRIEAEIANAAGLEAHRSLALSGVEVFFQRDIRRLLTGLIINNLDLYVNR